MRSSVTRRAKVASVASFTLLVVMRPAAADEPAGTSVRYTREIVRIFERTCVPCHAPGGPAMPLATYHDVLPWARAIREEILERRMPPWSAAPGVQPLANDISLSMRDIAIVVSWADGGAPRGDSADLPAAAPRPRWPAGEPALKLLTPPLPVAADGRLRVRRVALPTRLRSERWFRGFDLVPRDRRTVRAAFLFLQTRGGREEWLGGWTAGHSMTSAPAGVAYRLPASAVLTLEIHLLSWPPGSASTDRSEVGLYLADVPPPFLGRSLAISSPVAGDGTGRLRGERALDEDSVLWAFRPWLDSAQGSVRGSIEVAAVTRDGAILPLLWVKDLVPEWQTPYVLREPVRLPHGSRLIVTAYPSSSSSGSRATAGVSVASYRGAPAASDR